MTDTVVWTLTDEAPALASYSLLPIIRGFLRSAGLEVTTADISLAGRILAQFPERLRPEQRVPDYLAELGQLTGRPEAAIIKLPNISASVPQLKAAIAELQTQGFDVPDYPDQPATDEEREIARRYSRVLGSAVNPVLRQGNSDRRAPASVKDFARRHPHRLSPWDADSPARVVTMADDDFFGNELSQAMPVDSALDITLHTQDQPISLAKGVQVLAGEIVDTTFLSARALDDFYREQIEVAKDTGLLASLHLKATMMKVSDPVMFGHAVQIFFEPFLQAHPDLADGFDPKQGLGALKEAIAALPPGPQAAAQADLAECFRQRPALAMVDSARGITNLDAPNLVIIDASLPVVIRDGGRMWNADGQLQPTLAMVPDRCYGPMYETVFEDCKTHGALDPATMGSVPNVGLMAQQAEEYGSHATTFIAPADGIVVVTDGDGNQISQHHVQAGDIWRMSRVRDLPVRDWVRLAVARARATGAPAVFFLDAERPHDAEVIAKVRRYLPEHDLSGLDIRILAPAQAIQFCLDRARQGQDTISVTGNVLRDYLTDLFPILELGTSAKMLSIVPLLAGGGLFETGAGGSAPKHVQQFLAENYLRWDSLGEFSAVGACLEHVAARTGNARAQVLASTLDQAVARFLDENKSPARQVGQIDNRGSHYYFALYWAQALAAQDVDAELARQFTPIAQALADNEQTITSELLAVQGHPVDLGGYYHPDAERAAAAMRPSSTLNAIVDAL